MFVPKANDMMFAGIIDCVLGEKKKQSNLEFPREFAEKGKLISVVLFICLILCLYILLGLEHVFYMFNRL